MWTIGTHPFFILLLTKDELFKGIAPLKEKKRKKKRKIEILSLQLIFLLRKYNKKQNLQVIRTVIRLW